MCFSGSCKFEKWSGECGKKAKDVCPESFETDEEAEAAAEEYEDLRGEYLYEQKRDRELFG